MENLNQDIKFIKTNDGTTGLYSENVQDIFHSKTGALREAFEKFINPLKNIVDKNKTLNILDICYGIGYNTKTILFAYPDSNLNIDILEYNKELVLISPFIFDGIDDLCLKYFLLKQIESNLLVDNKYYIDILNKYKIGNNDFFHDSISFIRYFNVKTPYTNDGKPENNQFLHNIYYNYVSNRVIDKVFLNKYNNKSINFHIGDARKTINDCNNKYDIVFLDAFSSQKDPSLWTFDFLSLIKSKMNYNSVLVSYSKSTPFRSALNQLGFYIGKTFIDNVDMGTIASLNENNIINPLSDFDFELLSTRSGITYKDPLLNLSSIEILKNREYEQKNSNLVSHTQFLKKYNK